MSTRIITSPLVKTYTLEEFWELPDPPDRIKLELIAGVAYPSPLPEHIHDDIVSRLLRLLVGHLHDTDDKGGFYFPRAAIWNPDQTTHLEPDAFYLSAELQARFDPEPRTTADLVVEVISPGSAMYDRNTKAETYGALGVRELWLVDETAQTVEVRRQAGGFFYEGRTFEGVEQIESAVFPTLILRAEQLFAD